MRIGAAQYTGVVAAPAPFLFDLDGTIADTLADITATTNHVRQRHGLGPLGPAEVRALVGDGAKSLVRRALAPVLPPEGVDHDRAVDAAFDDYVAHHDHQCTVHASLFAGVRAHLDGLRSHGHRLAIVTNKAFRFARPIVAHLGLDDVVDVVIGGDTLPRKKPDPAPLLAALERLGGRTNGATMVGDGLQDLRAGKAAGLRTIACLFGYGDPASLRHEGADAYWSAFGTVSGTA